MRPRYARSLFSCNIDPLWETPAGMADKAARLSVGGVDVDLPVYSPTEGQDVIDVGKLTSQGYFTYDPGFVSTASCESAITYIDGDNGVLLHRGYPIEQLAEHSDHMELCYLLLNEALPTAQEKETFVAGIKDEADVDERYAQAFASIAQDAHPMGTMCSMTASLSAHYHADLNVDNEDDRMLTSRRLIAKMPTLAAMTYRHSQGLPFVPPRSDLAYGENFLNMMFSTGDDYTVSPVLARAMDRIFLLHADHEQNASTSTVRLAGSSGANPFACIAAGIASLWGPAHGGANEAVINMLEEINSIDNIPKFIEKSKDKNDTFRLMGFGHRVYKNYDPRAEIMKKTAHEVLNELNIKDDPLLKIALELEKIALNDEYFIQKKLYPNVDFYSGILLKSIGFPTSMFTVLFAIGRTVGWVSQWKEMIEDPINKIGRPRQLYNGKNAREYKKVDAREKKSIFNWLWKK